MTHPRIITAGSTVGITRRCILRKLLLTPMSPVVHQGLMFAYGMAQQKFDLLLHGEVIMPNHWHSALTTRRDNLPEVLEYFFGESSKFLKCCLAEHNYEPPENIWAGSCRPNVARLYTPESQLKWAHYIPSNPVTAGLVERVSEYPGHLTTPEVLTGQTFTIQRPDFYFSKRNNPESVEITYSMPTVLRQAFGSSERVIYQLQRALEETEKACRARGGTVLGAEAIKQQHPWSEPRSPRTFSTELNPTFAVGTGNHEIRKQCARETTTWRRHYRQSRIARLAGEQAVFPHGTYGMRVFHNAPVQSAEDLPPGTIINAPGILEDVNGCEASRMNSEEYIETMSNLRKSAKEDIPEPDDTLAARIIAGRADTVDRTDRNANRTDSGATENEETGAAAPRRKRNTANKRVVLRGSTTTAIRRRRLIQEHRATRQAIPEPNPPPT